MTDAKEIEKRERQAVASSEGVLRVAADATGAPQAAADASGMAQAATGAAGALQAAAGYPSAPAGPVDLNGEYRFKVDGKGRVSLPSKFRKVLSRDLVVTRDLEDECLYVFETPEFDAWVNRLFEERFGGYRASSREHVRLRRKLKSRSRDVEVDASGRIMLTGELREAVGIGKDVVLIGNTGYFEIWDAKRYEAQDDDTDLGVLFG